MVAGVQVLSDNKATWRHVVQIGRRLILVEHWATSCLVLLLFNFNVVENGETTFFVDVLWLFWSHWFRDLILDFDRDFMLVSVYLRKKLRCGSSPCQC